MGQPDDVRHAPFAELERALIGECQREGVTLAKAR